MEEGEKVNLTISNSGKDRKKSVDTNKGKIPTQPTIKKDSKCFFCKKKGHMKKDCPKFKSWFEKKGTPFTRSMHVSVGLKRCIVNEESSMLWHQRLGHISIEKIK